MVWKIYRSTFQQTEDISIVFLWRIWCQSVRKKFLAEARLIYAKEVSIKFHYLMKKRRHNWRLNNSNKTFLSQWKVWVFVNRITCSKTLEIKKTIKLHAMKSFFNNIMNQYLLTYWRRLWLIDLLAFAKQVVYFCCMIEKKCYIRFFPVFLTNFFSKKERGNHGRLPVAVIPVNIVNFGRKTDEGEAGITILLIYVL